MLSKCLCHPWNMPCKNLVSFIHSRFTCAETSRMLFLLFLMPQYNVLEGLILSAQFWFTFCWWKNILQNNSTVSVFFSPKPRQDFCSVTIYGAGVWDFYFSSFPNCNRQVSSNSYYFSLPFLYAQPIWWSNIVLGHYLYPGEFQGVGCEGGDLKQNKTKKCSGLQFLVEE